MSALPDRETTEARKRTAWSKSEKERFRAELGQALRRLRKRRGLTLEEVAVAMDMAPQNKTMISRWELGKVTIGSETLWAYLIAIGSTFYDLHQEFKFERDSFTPAPAPEAHQPVHRPSKPGA